MSVRGNPALPAQWDILRTEPIEPQDVIKPEDNAETLSNRPNQTLISTQTITHEYLTLNGKVARETVKKNGSVTDVMDFVYDESGRPFALIHQTDGVGITLCTYYYVLNLQGDVVKLVTASGDVVANYEYDAWGNILSQSGEMASINPLRYRGYYYDTETGFYYLQSRYYDSVNRRFINADSYASTGQDFVGTNMFAYCGNNPVARIDVSGLFWEEIAEFLGGIFGAGSTLEDQESPPPIESIFAPLDLLITSKSGMRLTTQLSKHGDSTKPISVYAIGRADDYALSSAGIKINIKRVTINLSLGLDNIGLSFQHSKGDIQESFAIKVDFSRLEVGVETAHTRKWDDTISSTHYNFYGISFAGIALAFAVFFNPEAAAAFGR